MHKRFTQNYHPLYFLAALGNGGLAVSFFMYLMFMVKHPDTPIPTFDHLYTALAGGLTVPAALTGAALAATLFFSYRHFQTLIWNLREYGNYKKSEAFMKLKTSNAEVNLMVIPLTLAMTVNVLFILGSAFVPGLWSRVEYLFPFALLAFAAVGAYGLKIFSEYFARLVIHGDFDFISNNNLSQLLASFAFAMIAVGMASPGAMSHNIAVSVLGILGAIFFSTLSVTLLFVKLVLGFKSIFKHGISKESAPSLWIVIPIMTLLGITFVRAASGIFHNMLHTEAPPVMMFVVLAFFISLQAIIGAIGYIVLKRTDYFKEYINGSRKSSGSYSLICPGVASFVLGMFFLHWGLVKTGVVGIFSIEYFALLLPLALIQFKTVRILFRIDRDHLCRNGDCAMRRASGRAARRSVPDAT